MANTPFPISPELTGIAIAYSNAEMVADAVLPRLEPRLDKRVFKYMRFDFGQTVTIPDTRVGRKGQPNEVEFSGTEVTDEVLDYGLDDPIPDDDLRNAPTGYDPRAFAVETLLDMVLLDREKRVASLVFDPSQYATSNKVTLSGTSQWSYATSDPLVAVQTAKDAMVMAPNKLVLGQIVWTQLRRNPNIMKAVSSSGTSNGRASLQAVADLFELDEIIVGAAQMNAVRRGQTPTLTRVWGKHALLFRQDKTAKSVSQKQPTFGFTMQYGDRIAGSQPDSKIGLRGGERVRAGESVKEVISAADLGYLFTNAVA